MTPAEHNGQRLRWMAGLLGLLILVNLALIGWLGRSALIARIEPDLAVKSVPPVAFRLEQGALPLPNELAAGEKRLIQVFEAAAPAVVFITTLKVRRHPFRRNVMSIPAGTGSGFVWDDKGHIVTNYHVIREGNAARITMSDQTSYNATLVGHAPDKDIAVLRIDAPAASLQPLKRGRSATLRVGQYTLAIGNPFGLDHTLSTGVVSGLEREIKSLGGRPIFGVVQTDAAVNPGNSGGPLLDSTGRLIGINTAIYSPSGASAGIGFAVPVDTVSRIVPQLIEHGKVVRPGLGIHFDPDLSRRAGGVLVLSIEPGSAADKAGLQPTRRDPRSGALILGDIITQVDGQLVKGQHDLFKHLDQKEVGDTVTVTVRRGEDDLDLKVTLTPLAEPR